MPNRTKHQPPELATPIQPDFSAYVQGQNLFSTWGSPQVVAPFASHAMGFPIPQVQISNATPILPTYYSQLEALYPPGMTLNSSSNSIVYYPQEYVPRFGSIVGGGTAGFTPTPPPAPSFLNSPFMQDPPLYRPVHPRDPPIMGNEESYRNNHLDNYNSAGYPPPPVSQQPLDQLKCQLDHANGFFRTGNLAEISKPEFLDNARILFVEGRKWCYFYPMKFHRDYKQPLHELADWSSMYFPDKFWKVEFEDILSLDDLVFMG